MGLNHREIVIVGQIIIELADYKIIDADIILDRIRMFFMLTRISGMSRCDAQEALEMEGVAMDIAEALRISSLKQIRRILEEVRSGVWLSAIPSQPEASLFVISNDQEQGGVSDNIIPFPYHQNTYLKK